MPRWDFSHFRWNTAGFGRVSGSHQKTVQLTSLLVQLEKTAEVHDVNYVSVPRLPQFQILQIIPCHSPSRQQVPLPREGFGEQIGLFRTQTAGVQ